MFLKGAIWKLYGVVMPGLNRHPGAVCIEGFTETDPVCYTAARNLLKIVLSGIEQCAFVSAIRGQELGVAGDQLPLVTRDSPAGWFPVFKTEIEKREKAPMECRVTYPSSPSRVLDCRISLVSGVAGISIPEWCFISCNSSAMVLSLAHQV
jgi:hypothetical protein